MSGIFGYSKKDNTIIKNNVNMLRHWNQCWGTNDSETILYEKTYMGCQYEHLSESLPNSCPVLQTERYIAVLDTVLYNREEVLASLNYNNNTVFSDEELMLHMIQQKGYNALATINGDFSGTVYDKFEHTWTLFRDHLGIRPLYYYIDENTFVFSTDMRGIAALPDVDLKVNEKKLYLRMRGYSDLSLCETEFEKIRCIHPASWTVIKEDEQGYQTEEHIYWKLGQKKIRFKSDEEYQSELRRLVTDSVKRRMDVVTGPIGCELSGGLDSSIIAILIRRLGREGRYYSWSDSPDEIPIKEVDERKVIQDICEQENISCAYTKREKQETIKEIYDKIDPPFLNTRFIGRGADYLRKQGAKVVFTGHGGDEGVSHRCNLFELWYHHEYVSFMKIIFRGTKNQKWRILRTVKRFLHQVFVVNPHFKKTFMRYNFHNLYLLNQNFVNRMKETVHPESLYFAYNPIGYIMQGGTRVRLDNVALQGAENGVRYMMPFLDYRVIDFAVSIPRVQYKTEFTNRYIYRYAFDDLMPQSLREVRYKDAPSRRGYEPDYDIRARFLELKKGILEYLDKEYWEQYLDYEKIENISLGLTYTWDECVIANAVIDELLICGAIQNVKRNAGKWSESSETNI